ncbi:MAG TPA: sugar-binding domain-containing protein [Terriglobales bacterium]|jgi:exo-1,4-beta-D-glucosaminidase
MKKIRYTLLLGFLWFLTVDASAQNRTQEDQTPTITLGENWRLQSSAKVQETGDVISTPRFRTAGWYPTKVPSTVLAALVDSKLYPDPYFGMNLRLIPGCSYPIATNFEHLPMPEYSPFRVSWWYRKEFRLPLRSGGDHFALHFDGINYRANIWLNGRKIADAKDVAGTFRLYEFDITGIVEAGAINTLAVEVFPPQPDDLALSWVDWNPTPPDKNMGIWHDVYVTTSGRVTVRHPQVITDLDLPSLDNAHLSVSVELKNTSNQSLHGTLRGRIEGIQVSQSVSIAPNETKTVGFTPQEFRQLNISHPRLWWPAGMGPQNLYVLEINFQMDGRISDRQTIHFGIRKMTSEVDKGNHRVFQVNGRNVLIRGGGWASDLLLRYMPARLEQEFQYVKDMYLNTIRTEGKLESDYFYNLADREGILIIAGWCCCDQWERWKQWDQEDYVVAQHSQEDQIRRLRNHPSILAWMNGSDHAPPPDVEKMYISVLEKYRWPNPYLSSAGGDVSQVTGTSGVKMAGPYEWVPPSYWLFDKDRGGAFGFATEISPGPAVPPIESLRRMLPDDHLWPIDSYWSYHCGGGSYKTLNVFTDGLNARYGEARSLGDYATKSQLMTYEAERAMFEAYARNQYRSSGVIQWMLNNSWPSMIWHLYDYYLRPGGGYFGTKKACEPIHVQYSYDDRSIVVVNRTSQPLREVKVTAKVFDLGLVEKYSNVMSVSVPPDGVAYAFVLPEIEGTTPTYFVKLTLENKDGNLLSSNFYWLSVEHDVLDWAKAKDQYTPTSSLADFTGLAKLHSVELVTAGRMERRGNEVVAHVTVENASPTLAFAVRLQIKRSRLEDEVLPVLWEDNYFSLMSGEKRELTARYRTRDLKARSFWLMVGGWNVELKASRLWTKARNKIR